MRAPTASTARRSASSGLIFAAMTALPPATANTTPAAASTAPTAAVILFSATSAHKSVTAAQHSAAMAKGTSSVTAHSSVQLSEKLIMKAISADAPRSFRRVRRFIQ